MGTLFLEDEATLSLADGLFGIAFLVVGILLIIASVASLFISIWLWIRYAKYNRKKNSAGLEGRDIARNILDDNDLQNIKVKCSGSMLFGNSYSHFFKKIRLRRLTWKKKSVTALAMASEKSCLAILDKEGDKDMKQRIKLTPIIYFGPLAVVPLLLVGVILDIIIFNSVGLISTIFTLIGLAFYALSFVFSVKILKTEIKAQKKALEVVKQSNLANDEEVEDMKRLFKLYNIEYINDMIIALLELIWRVLQILVQLKNSKVNSSNKK